MKKYIVFIIVALCSFSIANTTSAQSIDQILQIQTGVEAFDISQVKLDSHTFKTASIQSTYDTFVSTNTILRSELINKYRNGDFEYYQMQGIIKNYSGFIYHTNKLFTYLSIKDSGIKTKEVDTAILRSYQNVRIYYNRMKSLVAKSY